MQRNIDRINASLRVAAHNAPALEEAFYTRLYALRPRLRSLVPMSPKQRSERLMNLLGGIVQRLNRTDALARHARALALRADLIGVTEDDYDAMERSLNAAFAETLGPQWDGPTQQAWTNLTAVLRGLSVEALDLHHRHAA